MVYEFTIQNTSNFEFFAECLIKLDQYFKKALTLDTGRGKPIRNIKLEGVLHRVYSTNQNTVKSQCREFFYAQFISYIFTFSCSVERQSERE